MNRWKTVMKFYKYKNSLMDIQATNVFKRNYQSKARYVINRGGTRSSKTYSLAQLCALRLYSGQIEEWGKVYDSWVLSIVRKHSTTIRATAMRDFDDIIDTRGIRDKIDTNKTEKTYKYQGRTVEFFGADNQQKLRWGSRDILYCNEANELIRDQEFFQLMIRTKDKIFIDFNPDNEDIWINQELEIKRKEEVWDVDVIISTYKDNKFLPEMQVKEIERLEKTNPQYWKIYWLWEYGRLEWLVFERYETLPDVPADARLVSYGLDFGYTNDPTAMIAVYKWNWSLVLDEIFYKRWLINVYKDIDDKIGSIVGRFEENLIDKSADIWADSSEPKSIAEIYMAWYNIKPVEKWPDSIRAWIDLMKQYNIYITARSSNLLKEFRKYTRSQDKEGKYLNKPIDVDNHWIDASRYAVMSSFKNTFETKDRWKVYSVNAVDVLY